MDEEAPTYTAFAGTRLVASGAIETMLPQLKAWADRRPNELSLVFEDQTGKQVDFDLRGTTEEALARAMPARTAGGPGRPKLGVVSREISLLPRHWEWLEEQPNGASATLRRLVDEARKHEPDKQRARRARDAASRFLTAMAGNFPGYEEAGRALYAGERDRFEELVKEWPGDVRRYAMRLADEGF